jgi:hypothetical protein
MDEIPHRAIADDNAAFSEFRQSSPDNSGQNAPVSGEGQSDIKIHFPASARGTSIL